ncbi:hypothetical protein CBR_g48852 [Chara braunii]|uniref:DUF659 domain-containing protein n=1 Tax=Chara braunii TaxID=69332 RepID=A0A388M3S4_CHABU|nr:hypothetical protein CBR_g48852 [Chara braunii]|eukprot:GBG89145.1 hypothetical protein CBR_g48852 [Chara braunii]
MGISKEIEADAVVGVVMDNVRVCVKAGKMVEAAYPNIFRVGCTAHALDLALEDMYKEMPWMEEVVDSGNKVCKFFMNVDNKAEGCVQQLLIEDEVEAPDDNQICHQLRDAWVFEGPQKRAGSMRLRCEMGGQDGTGRPIGGIPRGDDYHYRQGRVLEQPKQGARCDAVCGGVASWEAFGFKHDLLAPQAIKLLGQASSSAACERNWSSLHELIYGRRHTKLMPERMVKLVYNSWNVRLLRCNQHGGGDDIHIPWADDVPMEKETKEWYVDWLTRVHGDVDKGEVVVVNVDDEEDDFPLWRTFQRNDAVDERLCQEEDSVLLDKRAWMDGREEAPRRRPKNKGKEKDDGNATVQRGKRKAVEQQQPRPKRGRTTLAEQAERRGRKAVEKAAKAAAAAVKAVGNADKAKAAAKATARNSAAGKTKRVAVINDDDDDIPEDIRGDEEPEGSASTSSSPSTSLESSGGKGMEEGDKEEVGEGVSHQEESGEEEWEKVV